MIDMTVYIWPCFRFLLVVVCFCFFSLLSLNDE